MRAAVSKLQISLDFDAALTQQYRTFKQCLAACVYGSKGGLGGVAIHCDLSPSALSRMLNENEDDPRHLPADLVPLIIEATQDYRPIHWLVARFLPDDSTRHQAAVRQLETLIPQLNATLATLAKVSK
jgi:hypothetical protein